LRELNDQYNNIKIHSLLMDPIPPITKIFLIVVQQEWKMVNNVFIARIKTVNLHLNTNQVSQVFSHLGVIHTPKVFGSASMISIPIRIVKKLKRVTTRIFAFHTESQITLLRCVTETWLLSRTYHQSTWLRRLYQYHTLINLLQQNNIVG